MKLIEVKKNSCPKGKPSISFNPKNGYICLNAYFGSKTGHKAGTAVTFFQSDEDKRDWYFSIGKQGSIVTRQNTSDALMMNGADICRRILESLDINDHSNRTVTFLVSIEPENIDGKSVYSIITRARI